MDYHSDNLNFSVGLGDFQFWTRICFWMYGGVSLGGSVRGTCIAISMLLSKVKGDITRAMGKRSYTRMYPGRMYIIVVRGWGVIL